MKSVFICFFIVAGSLFLPAQTVFQKTYGDSAPDGAWCVQQTADGGFIITAETLNYGSGGDEVYLLKTDSSGAIQWTRTFGGASSHEYGNMVRQTMGGGFIITGISYSFGSGNGDVYLIKTDPNGNIIWSKTFGGLNLDEGFSVEQTLDTGFIVAGITKSFGAGQADAYLIKTDKLGNMIWNKTYGGPANEGFPGSGNISVHQTYDGGYIIADYTNSFGAGGYDLYLIKTNSTGVVIWSKTYGGTGDEFGFGNNVGQTGDGGFIAVGLTRTFGAGQADVYLMKTNGNGDLLWSKTYGGTLEDYGYFVEQTTDGGYIISGTTRSFGAGLFDMYLIKTDATGNMLWSKSFGGTGTDNGYSVDQTTDGGYVVGGYTDSYGLYYTDIYLVKTDANGNSSCNESNPATLVSIPPTIETTVTTLVSTGCIATIPATIQDSGGMETTLCLSAVGIQAQTRSEKSISIYPNPSNGIFTISNPGKISQIQVYNSVGELVVKQFVPGGNNQLNLEKFPSGIYFAKCFDKEYLVATIKLVVTE